MELLEERRREWSFMKRGGGNGVTWKGGGNGVT